MGLTQSLGSLANEGLLTALLVFAEHLEREGKVRLQDDYDDDDDGDHDHEDADHDHDHDEHGEEDDDVKHQAPGL